MSQTSIEQFSRYLHQVSSPSPPTADEQLLQRFVDHQDEEAFRALVHRHGSMVLGVCRRILGQMADAEDAFQATFLTLAQQASSIRDSSRLVAWLHRVAFRIAHKAKAQSRPELGDCLPVLVDNNAPPTVAGWRELWQTLDQELNRLSEHLRVPLVLCYLEGLTRDEAAERQGCSLSTLKRRLEQGRRLLRNRLQARGTLPTGLALAVLLPDGLSARVSPTLTQRTVALASTRASSSLTSNVVCLARAGAPPVQPSFFHILMLTLLPLCGLCLGGFLMLAQAEERLTSSTPPTQKVNQPAPRLVQSTNKPPVDQFGDPLPAGAVHRFGTIRYRHGGGFNSATLSADGKRLIAASEIGVTVFEVATGKPLVQLRETGVPNGFGPNQRLVAISPDGKMLASLAGHSSIRIWDGETGKELRRIGQAPKIRGFIPRGAPLPQSRFSNVHRIRFVNQGKKLLVGERSSVVHYVDPTTGKEIRRLQLMGELYGISKDESILMVRSATNKRNLILHEATTGKVLRELNHKQELEYAVLSADKQRAATYDSASQIVIWDVTTGKQLHRIVHSVPLPDKRLRLTVLEITPDNSVLLVGTQGGEILRWDLATGKKAKSLTGGLDYVTGFFFTPEGATLISTGWDGVFHRWDLKTGKEHPLTDGFLDHLQVVLSPDGRIAVLGDGIGRLETWSTETGKKLRVLRRTGPGISRLAFSPNGKHLAVGQKNNEITLWSTATWRIVRSFSTPKKLAPGKSTWFSSLTFTPDSRALLSASSHTGMDLRDVVTGKEIWHQPVNGRVAFSPAGRVLVTGGWNKSLTFRDPKTGRALHSVSTKDVIDDIQFSPDGRHLATGHHGGLLFLRNPLTGAVARQLSGYKDVVWEVSFSPDSKWLFSTGCDHSVRLHEVATGQELLRLDGHDGRVYHGQFGADGLHAVSAAWDLMALWWSLRPANVPEIKGSEEQAWKDLASQEAPVAYRAGWALLDHPKEAVKLFRARLKSDNPKVNRKQILQWIADLDSRNFQKRESASAELQKQGAAIEKLLKESLAGSKSPEQKQRIQQLLARLKGEPTPEVWRLQRAVQVLELSKDNSARELLQEWANQSGNLVLREQAKEALARLR